MTPGRTSPSVDCPLVDFFCDPAGTCDGVNTALVGVRRGFNAYFPMPVQKSVLTAQASPKPTTASQVIMRQAGRRREIISMDIFI